MAALESADAMNRRVLSIGECMVEFAPAGDGLFKRGFAGDTFNTAWYLRRALPADWTVSYFTCLGDDQQSADMLDFMRRAGVTTGSVQVRAGESCGLYTISLDAEGERSFSYWRAQAAARKLADDAALLRKAAENAACLYFSGITLAILPDEGRRNLLQVAQEARDAGRLVAFDSNLRLRLWRDSGEARYWLTTAYGIASLVLPSFADEHMLFGDEEPRQAAQRIRDAGAAEVALKNGEQPCLVVTDSGTHEIAAPAIANPVDTTGAGDSFNAAYIAARLRGGSPLDAARSGHELASRVVMGRGALVEV